MSDENDDEREDDGHEVAPAEWASRLLKLLDENRSAPPAQLRPLLEQFVDDVQMNVYLSGSTDLTCFFVGRFTKLEQDGVQLDISMVVNGDDRNAEKNFPALLQTSRGVVIVSRESTDGDRRVQEARIKRGHH